MKVLLANKFFYLKGGTEYVLFDTVRLLQGGQVLTAVGLLTLQNGAGLLCFWAGLAPPTG